MKDKSNQGQIMDEMLVQYLIGPISEPDRKTIEEWLLESPENLKYFNSLKDLYFLGRITSGNIKFDKEQSLERIKSRYYRLKADEIPEKKNNFRIRYWTAIAACFVLAVGLGFYLKSVFTGSEPMPAQTAKAYNEITAPMGSRPKIVLPDGSIVWLNAGSTLKYPMNFLTDNREVQLSGEAFFEVSKMPDKRFVVNASDIAIRVWGTKFNVKAYPEEKTIETTLVEGSVSIEKLKGKSKEKATYLSPNQVAVFYKADEDSRIMVRDQALEQVDAKSRMLIKEKINTLLYTSWKDEKWVIEGEQLGDLATELERRYNVDIIFDNNSIKNYRFTGTFTNETFEQLLEIIKMSAPIDFSVNNNTILLKENSSSRKKYDKFLTR